MLLLLSAVAALIVDRDDAVRAASGMRSFVCVRMLCSATTYVESTMEFGIIITK